MTPRVPPSRHQVVDWVADYRERAASLPVIRELHPAHQVAVAGVAAFDPRVRACCVTRPVILPDCRTGSIRVFSATSLERRVVVLPAITEHGLACSACRAVEPGVTEVEEVWTTGCGRWWLVGAWSE